MLIESLSATISIAAGLMVSSGSANLTIDQDASISALPSGPIPSPSSTPSSVFSDSLVIQLPPANNPLSPLNNFTANIQFHIPDSPIDLAITTFGKPLSSRTLNEIVELALDHISSVVALHPTESITNGFFRQNHEGLEITIHQYGGKQISWYFLDLLLLGIQCYASQLGRACEIRFGIDVEDQGRVGHGSLWQIGPGGNDVAKRAADETPRQLSLVRVPKPAPTKLNDSSIPPPLNDSNIIFSYHFFGRPIAGPAMSLCFENARRRIRTDVQLHPNNPIPNGRFEYRLDSTSLLVGVEAYAGNEISWLLLDHILRDVSARSSYQHLGECEFEFELDPFMEEYGRGYFGYFSAASDVL